MNNNSIIRKRKLLLEAIGALNHLNESIINNSFLTNQEIADKACDGKLKPNLKYMFEAEYPDCCFHFSEKETDNDTVYFADFSSKECDNRLELSSKDGITWHGEPVLDVFSSSDDETVVEEICKYINYADRYVSMASAPLDSILKEYRNKLLIDKYHSLEKSLINILPQVKIAHLSSQYQEKDILETIKNNFACCCPDCYLDLYIISNYNELNSKISLKSFKKSAYDNWFSLNFYYSYDSRELNVSIINPTVEYQNYIGIEEILECENTDPEIYKDALEYIAALELATEVIMRAVYDKIFPSFKYGHNTYPFDE